MSDVRPSGDRDATEEASGGVDTDREAAYGENGERENAVAEWLTSTAIRWTLLLVGLVLLLFALGRAFDTPFLGWVVDAATSETGRWLVVALVALALIALAAAAPWND